MKDGSNSSTLLQQAHERWLGCANRDLSRAHLTIGSGINARAVVIGSRSTGDLRPAGALAPISMTRIIDQSRQAGENLYLSAMNTEFTIDFFSDSKYENMTAEVSFSGEILFQVNMDKGRENLEIELFHEWARGSSVQKQIKFPIHDLVETLEVVMRELPKHLPQED